MNPILDEIKNAFDYLDYKEHWDDENAKPINEKCFVEAINFLLYYLNNKIEIVDPEINPCPNGTIDISFRNEKNKARLLINFREDEFAWYGDVNEESEENSQSDVYGHNQKRLNNWILTHLIK